MLYLVVDNCLIMNITFIEELTIGVLGFMVILQKGNRFCGRK